MEDQPVNGKEPHESAVAEMSPTQRAYIDSIHAVTIACSEMVSMSCPGLPQHLGLALIKLNADAKMREVEMQALVELLETAKIITKDEWLNKSAAMAEKYAVAIQGHLAQVRKDAAPQLAIATTIPPRRGN
jgi:adenine deaminase